MTPCGARARSRNGEPCRNPPVRGEVRCRFHGGRAASVNRGKPNLARVSHGERSKFVPKDRQAAKLKKLLATPSGKAALLAENVANRRAWRGLLDESAELDTTLKLDDADRADVTAMVKVEEAQAGAGNAQIVIQAPNLTAPILTPVRGIHGMTDVLQLEGRWLMRDQSGAFRPAHETHTDEGASLWVFDDAPPLLEAGE